ncbi:MAG: DUF92 domain-containing protein [candidate division KSB1 bacterium]|nr:DUF92 domain-containing protein [candidate division KSB1 bacterium]MDZ7272837.1 DUF92 domain-containing protein [candidate division KSB1 bacterium]MDZ7284140.1 DUF92 domain-containing protein [candidate division KSB1 bacterium]MDZ7297462.1 DUF92 domain-containing protein [candidate division KSB1 bacterium]MDZ7305598.1 DUF92 domain-containing protein [candidate division KSB1 bacterium]
MPDLHFPPPGDWLIFALFLLGLSGLIGFANWMQRVHAVSAERTRKLVHVLSGVAVLLSPFLFATPVLLLVLAALFVLLNALALRTGRFAGIHATGRKTYGTVFYPLSFFLLTLLFWQREMTALWVGMSLLGIADFCAALAGGAAVQPIVLPLRSDRKTLQGSLTMWLSSLLLVWAGFEWIAPLLGPTPEPMRSLLAAVGISLLATAAEALSWRGSDNLTVPVLGAVMAYFYLHASQAAITQFFTGEILALAVAAVSYRVRFLDLSGALATFMLGAVVFGLGGWVFSVPLLAFFVLSSLLSRFGARRKRAASRAFQKGHRRDFGQVVANGGVPGLVVILWYIDPQPLWYALFLGAVAAVTADTWATEIGLLSRRPPRLITTLQTVTAGTSGAISGLGLFGAGLGAFIIALLGAALQFGGPGQRFGVTGIAFITLAGVLAHLFDSLLGATIQAQRICPTCRRISEKKGECCGSERQPHSGWHWVDNDVVNGICAVSGVLAVLLALPVLQ